MKNEIDVFLYFSVFAGVFSVLVQFAYIMHHRLQGKSYWRLVSIFVVMWGAGVHLGVILGWWASTLVGVNLLRPIAALLWLIPAFDTVIDWSAENVAEKIINGGGYKHV